MRVRTTILLGAATLVGALANGAVAQTSDDYARYGGGPPTSTPAEMQQTDELNRQSTNGTYRSPSALNGEQSAQNAPVTNEGTNGPAPYQPAQVQYTQPPPGQSEPQAQYQSQQHQYQDQVQRYRDQQQRYGYDRERYEQNLRDYDVAQYEWSYPAAYAYHYGEEPGLRPLYLIAEPSQQLWNLPVEGPGGRWVGRVRNIDIGPDSKPFRVEIALNRRVSVWVSPADLRYDGADRILYTDLTRGDLWEMPGATIESTPM